MTIKTRAVGATIAAAAALGVGYGVASASTAQPAAQPTAHVSPHYTDPGSWTLPTEQSFVALPACRIANFTLDRNGVRNLIVRGTTGFPGQGGKSGGCKVPKWADAVQATIISTAQPAAGSIIAYPTGSARPTVATLLHGKQSTAMIGGILRLAGPKAQPLSLYAGGSTTHVSVDISGYFTAPIAAFVTGSGRLDGTTGRVLSVDYLGEGAYAVHVDRTLDFCTPTVTPDAPGAIAWAYTTGHDVQVRTSDLANTGGANDADEPFTLLVTC